MYHHELVCILSLFSFEYVFLSQYFYLLIFLLFFIIMFFNIWGAILTYYVFFFCIWKYLYFLLFVCLIEFCFLSYLF